jgi:hypothetical protein
VSLDRGTAAWPQDCEPRHKVEVRREDGGEAERAVPVVYALQFAREYTVVVRRSASNSTANSIAPGI